MDETNKLQQEIEKFEKGQRAKTYSERHPELGRMIKCAKCGRRHYSIKVCEMKYATHRSSNKGGVPYYEDESPMYAPLEDQFGSPNKGAIFGAAQFKGRRVKPHPHPLVNEIFDRASRNFKLKEQQLAEAGDQEQADFTVAFRAAKKHISNRIRRQKKLMRRQQDISRRINVGLIGPGSRP